MKNSRHLFVLAPGVLNSTSPDEIEATKRGLQEVGLYHMPYDRDVYIEVSALDAVGPDALPHINVVYGPFGKDQEICMALHDTKNGILSPSKPFGDDAAFYADILVALLATKNAEKRTSENKLAKLGIGKSIRNRFATTTVISLPRDLPPDGDNPPKGGSITPHLRRGHVRLQQKIWIAPVFVNADPDFVAGRTKYKIKVKTLND